MEFRPCIDIHNGKVKQIVGSSLRDEGDLAKENFVSEKDGSFFGAFYRKDNLKGGHVILLNAAGSDYYEATKRQAKLALAAYPGGLQVGGGINTENAAEFLDAGASHVIVTSYVFENGVIHYPRLRALKEKVGKKHLVLDVSCRKKGEDYYVVTNRWQTFTDTVVDEALLSHLATFADEFLVHAVDVEGKQNGVETELVSMLADCCDIPITYAGGIGSFADLETLRAVGKNRLNVTVGSALDLFGGPMEYKKVIEFCRGTQTC